MNAGLVSTAMMKMDTATGDDGSATAVVADMTTVGKMRGTLAFPDHDADTATQKWRPIGEARRAKAARCKSDGGGVRVAGRGRTGTKSREETNSTDEEKRDTRTRNEHMAPWRDFSVTPIALSRSLPLRLSRSASLNAK